MKPRSMQTRLQREAAPAGANPIFRTRSWYAKKKYTLHMYAKRSGVVHWGLSDTNADTNEIERVAREAVEQVEGGETLSVYFFAYRDLWSLVCIDRGFIFINPFVEWNPLDLL